MPMNEYRLLKETICQSMSGNARRENDFMDVQICAWVVAYINRRLDCKPTVVRHPENIRIKKWKWQIKRMLMMTLRFFLIFNFICLSFKFIVDVPVPLIFVDHTYSFFLIFNFICLSSRRYTKEYMNTCVSYLGFSISLLLVIIDHM